MRWASCSASTGRLHVGADDHELVAAGAGGEVGGSQHAAAAGGRSATSSSSPAAWPSASLTSLKRSRSRNRTATYVWVRDGALQREVQGLEEQRPVGQAGERVVRGVVGQRSSRCLRSVTSNITPSSQQRVAVLVVGGLALLHDPPHAAVAVADRVLDHERAPGAQRVVELPVAALAVAGQDEVVEEHLVAEELLGGVPGQLVHGVAHELVDVRRRRLAAVDRARDVLHQGAQPGLARSQLALGPHALADVAEADHDAPDRRVVEQVARLDLDRDPLARGVAQPHLEGPGMRPAVQELAESPRRDRAVVGVDEVHRARAVHGRGSKPSGSLRPAVNMSRPSRSSRTIVSDECLTRAR